MVLNILEAKDLLELALLKCKVCRRRLQSPVLQVDVFTNVCESCCDRSVHTNAVRNVDLEALLQKLYLPCNYEEKGCEFEGSFDEVCSHEKICLFSEIKCPLATYDQCEGHIDDAIEHMKSKHPDSVLTVVENHVSIKNPTRERLSVFYLLVVGDLHFILRAQFDVNEGHIVYCFDCLNYNIDIEHVKISIVLKYDYTICNVDNVHINRLRKGEMFRMIYEKDVTKLNFKILESFGCSDSITVKIDTANNIVTEKINAKSNKSVGRSCWYKCTKCSAISTEILFCVKYNRPIYCRNCSDKAMNDNRCNCPTPFVPNEIFQQLPRGTSTHIVIDLSRISSNSTFLCTNAGCNKEISGDNYNFHTTSQCRFRQLHCPFAPNIACSWYGNFMDLVTHITSEHATRVNQDSCAIPSLPFACLSQICFIKENNVFIQTYQILNNQLIVTTNKLDGNEYGSNYKWVIHVKHPANGCETLTSSMCTNNESKRIIDITGYLNKDPFKFKVVFKRT